MARQVLLQQMNHLSNESGVKLEHTGCLHYKNSVIWRCFYILALPFNARQHNYIDRVEPLNSASKHHIEVLALFGDIHFRVR